MRDRRFFAVLIGSAVICGAAGINDLAQSMDPTAAKFGTEECQHAREKALAYSERLLPRAGAGAAIGVLLGPLGIPLAVVVDAAQASERDAVFNGLINDCGDDALSPWFQQEAEKGDANSQAWIAQLYVRNGKFERAIYWYQRSSDQGFVPAQVNLGGLYYEGKGTSEDYAKAAYWWRKAADKGSAPAQTNLGELYAHRTANARDYDEARKWYRMAATQGHAKAQYELAELYANGAGVTQDYFAAYTWYTMALDNGYDAATKLDEAGLKLNRNEIARAKAKARQCRNSGYRVCL